MILTNKSDGSHTSGSETPKTPKTPKTMKDQTPVKSSLQTENCKLVKQFMIAQNMASHYKRILNVKSSIDMKPPQSIVKSQKARDRARREVSKSAKLNESLISAKVRSRPQSADISKSRKPTELFDDQTLNTFRSLGTRSQQVNKSMLDLMNSFTHSHDQLRVKHFTVRNGHAVSQSVDFDDKNLDGFFGTKSEIMMPLKNKNFNSESLNNTFDKNKLETVLNQQQSRMMLKSYDVLEIHAKSFGPHKEFVPRIKNRKGESKLKQTGYYNPPKSRRQKITINESGVNTTIKPTNNKENQNIPEQSIKEQTIQSVEPSKPGEKTSDLDPNNRKQHIENIAVSNESKKDMQRDVSPKLKPLSIKRVSEREDEILYLNFIKEVTDDIIARGVCTNRVINNIFEYHLSRNKDKLNMTKMKELLATLRTDLKISNHDEDDSPTEYSTSIQKASVYDEERKFQHNIDSNENYLTLNKFGWSNDYDKPDHGTSNVLDNLSKKPPSITKPSRNVSPALSTTSIRSQVDRRNKIRSPETISASTMDNQLGIHHNVEVDKSHSEMKTPNRNASPALSNGSIKNNIDRKTKNKGPDMFEANMMDQHVEHHQSKMEQNVDSIKKSSPPLSPLDHTKESVNTIDVVEHPEPIKQQGYPESFDENSISHRDENDARHKDSNPNTFDDDDEPKMDMMKTIKHGTMKNFKLKTSIFKDDDDYMSDASSKSVSNTLDESEDELDKLIRMKNQKDKEITQSEAHFGLNKTSRNNSKSGDEISGTGMPKPVPRKSHTGTRNNSDDSF